MDWIAQLKDLSIGIAFSVVFIAGIVLVLRKVIQPFQNELKNSMRSSCDQLDRIVTNHLAHDRDERTLTRTAITEVSAAMHAQCRSLGTQTQVLQGLATEVREAVKEIHDCRMRSKCG